MFAEAVRVCVDARACVCACVALCYLTRVGRNKVARDSSPERPLQLCDREGADARRRDYDIGDTEYKPVCNVCIGTTRFSHAARRLLFCK